MRKRESGRERRVKRRKYEKIELQERGRKRARRDGEA